MADIHQPLLREIELATVLAALSDPARLAIIKEIHEAGELCAAALSLDLCKSTVSHHMKVLREAGITWTECEGAERRVMLRYDCSEMRLAACGIAKVMEAYARASCALRNCAGRHPVDFPPTSVYTGTNPKMRSRIAMLILAGALTACASHPQSPTARPVPRSTVDSLANGSQIFQTGRDADGKRITAAHPPMRASCAACHGASGAGGLRITDDVVSADLRHRALVTDQKPPYNLALLERAISTGVDNQGKPLDPVMPRWHLSQRDLQDVAKYVYTRLK